MEENNASFSYTYSGKEQAEVEKIRNKYLPKEENKLEQLRKLDSIPQRNAQVWSLCLGVVGTLLLGSGMSLFMTDLGSGLGFSQTLSLVLGILVGVFGMVLVALAHPVYLRVLKKEQQRIAPEILRLTDELMK